MVKSWSQFIEHIKISWINWQKLVSSGFVLFWGSFAVLYSSPNSMTFTRLSQWTAPVFHELYRSIACYGCMSLLFRRSRFWPCCTLITTKIKSPQVPIQPCRLRSDSAPPGTIEAQLKLKQPHQKAIPAHAGPISALRSKSALGNWTVLALIKGAKFDLQRRTVFYSSKRPLFLGLKLIFLI